MIHPLYKLKNQVHVFFCQTERNTLERNTLVMNSTIITISSFIIQYIHFKKFESIWLILVYIVDLSHVVKSPSPYTKIMSWLYYILYHLQIWRLLSNHSKTKWKRIADLDPPTRLIFFYYLFMNNSGIILFKIIIIPLFNPTIHLESIYYFRLSTLQPNACY